MTFQGKTFFFDWVWSLSVPCMLGTNFLLGMRVLREHTKSKKFDLERSSYVGQINKAQYANLKIAIINGGLLIDEFKGMLQVVISIKVDITVFA